MFRHSRIRLRILKSAEAPEIPERLLPSHRLDIELSSCEIETILGEVLWLDTDCGGNLLDQVRRRLATSRDGLSECVVADAGKFLGQQTPAHASGPGSEALVLREQRAKGWPERRLALRAWGNLHSRALVAGAWGKVKQTRYSLVSPRWV